MSSQGHEEMIEEIKENIFENEAHEDVQTLLDSYNEQMHKLLDSNNEQIMEVKTLVEGLHLILHSCPEGWNKFQMNCYKFFTEKKVWSEARADCLDHQSDLASIHSYEEDKFVFDLADGMRFWLGGHGLGLTELLGTSRTGVQAVPVGVRAALKI